MVCFRYNPYERASLYSLCFVCLLTTRERIIPCANCVENFTEAQDGWLPTKTRGLSSKFSLRYDLFGFSCVYEEEATTMLKKGEGGVWMACLAQAWNLRRNQRTTIVAELKLRGSPSLANQSSPNFGNRRRRARSTCLPKKFWIPPTIFSGTCNPRSP
jgi:hypothetical protein